MEIQYPKCGLYCKHRQWVDAGRIGDPPPPTKHEGFGGPTPGVLVGDELNKKIYAALTAGLKGHEKQKKTRNYLDERSMTTLLGSSTTQGCESFMKSCSKCNPKDRDLSRTAVFAQNVAAVVCVKNQDAIVHCNMVEEHEGYRAGYWTQKQLRAAEMRRRERVKQKLDRKNRAKRKEAQKRKRAAHVRFDDFGNMESGYGHLSKRARRAVKMQETKKRKARKSNAAALAAGKVLCKNLCGNAYLAKSKAALARHEKICKWAWSPGEETGVPVTTQETPAATGGTGMDVLMGIA